MNDSLSYAKDPTYLSNAEAMWFDIWLFGIVIDDDLSWYMPDDEDTSYPLIDPLWPLSEAASPKEMV